jgi:hypothetical protein
MKLIDDVEQPTRIRFAEKLMPFMQATKCDQVGYLRFQMEIVYEWRQIKKKGKSWIDHFNLS